MSPSKSKLVRRYTNLPILMDMLVNKRLTIVGYNSWVDANDRYAMDLYKAGDPKIKFLGAYCVAKSTSQTFHQWKVFADGPSGVCVNFNGDLFNMFVRNLTADRYICREVKYVPYKQAQAEQDVRLQEAFEGIDRKNIPFVKRHGFSAEDEFRILYSSEDASERSHHIPIDLNMISEIILSPFLHDGLVDSVKGVLKRIPGCPPKVSKARMTDNKTWQKSLDRYAALAAGEPNA